MPLWRLAWAEQDELRTLHRWQAIIAVDRGARSNGWAAVRKPGTQTVDDNVLFWLKAISGDSSASAFDRFRFLFSTEPFGVSETLIRRTLAVQTHKRMAETAIALRRFHLQHGSFPADLNALLPNFLPTLPVDEMNKQPLHYRTNDNGTFTLYSVGENGTDDHGDSTPSDRTYSYIWHGKDAIWPSPATAEEVAEAIRRQK